MADWAYGAPTWLLGLALFAAMLAAAWLGAAFSQWRQRRGGRGAISEAQEGYVLTSVYTLVGLLLAFTFGMALDRFDQRRGLVLRDATAIETLYVDARLLPEPHRSRISDLLVRHARNHIELAQARKDDADANRLLSESQSLLDELREAAVPAFDSIRNIDFSSTFVESLHEVIKADAARKAARRATIPETIILLLMFYSLIAAAVLGAIMRRRRAEALSVALLALFVLAFMLLNDINRPVSGTIRESQEPMQRMFDRINRHSPSAPQPAAAGENQPGSDRQ
ncbi:MAG TPA: hypothetical protein VIT45_14335 [Allosphingosinicella sp.]